MSDVLDIIHKFTYEIQGQQQIENVRHLFEKNAQEIGKNTASLLRLQKQLEATTDPSRQAKLNQAIQARTKAIESEKKAITDTILNNKEYHKSLQQEMGIINSLNARLSALKIARDSATNEADIKKYSEQIQAVQKEQASVLGGSKGGILASIGSGLSQGLGIAGGLGIASAIAGSIGAIKDFGVESFKAAANFEQLKVAFATMTGSQNAGNQLLQEIQDFASVTPYGTSALVDLSKQLLAYGLSAKEIIPTIDMLGNVAAGVGADKMPQLILAFGQVRASGKLMGQELLQFVNAGFNPLQEISAKTGKSMGVLRKEMEKGAISFKMVEQAFKDATSEGGKFNNLMQQQSKTTAGRIDAMGDSVERLRIAIGEKMTGAVGVLVTAFTSLVETITDYITLDVTEKTRQEQQELNALVYAITGVNDNQKIRVQLIDELIRKSPEWFGQIDREKITNAELVGILGLVNQQYEKRLLLISRQKTAQEAADRATAAQDKVRAQLNRSGGIINNAINAGVLTQQEREIFQQYGAFPSATRDRLQQLADRGTRQVRRGGGLTTEFTTEAASALNLLGLEKNKDLATANKDYHEAMARLSQQTALVAKQQADYDNETKRQLDEVNASLKNQNLSQEQRQILLAQQAALMNKIKSAEEKIMPTDTAETAKTKDKKVKERDFYKEAINAADNEYRQGNEYSKKLEELLKQKERLVKAYLDYINSEQYQQDSYRDRVQNQRIFEGGSANLEREIALAQLQADRFKIVLEQGSLGKAELTEGLKKEQKEKIQEALQDNADKIQDLDIRINVAQIGIANAQNVASPDISNAYSNDLIKGITQRYEAEQQRLAKFEIEEEEKRKRRNAERLEAVQELSNNIISIYQMELDSKIRMIDYELDYRERRLSKAQELAEKGNVEALKEEENRIDQLYKKREEMGRKQIQLNALIQASEMAKSVAESIGAVVSAAVAGEGYTAAFRIAATVAALVAGIASIKSAMGSFAEGGYTGDGGKYEVAGTVHKGEYVLTQEDVKRLGGKDAIDRFRQAKLSLNDLYKAQFVNPQSQMSYNYNSMNIDELSSKLDVLTKTVSGLSFSANQTLNEHGLTQMINVKAKNAKNRFK